MTALTHEQWQTQIVEMAHLLGWRHLHVRRSIGKGRRWTTATNVVGWPDLLCWHPARGLVAIECKVGRDKATVEQVEVLASLALAGVRTMVAYPADVDAVIATFRTAAPNGPLT